MLGISIRDLPNAILVWCCAHMIYQIDTGYACFGLVVKDGTIVEAAPIAKWTIGKNVGGVLDYYRKKKAKVIGPLIDKGPLMDERASG